MAVSGFTDVYVAPLPSMCDDPVYPPERHAQITATRSAALRHQRYGVWKLLEHAITHSLSLPFDHVRFVCDERGRWSCDACYFSISHSDNAVAVAVSDRPVGVDIERLDRPHGAMLPDKILTDEQRSTYDRLPPADRPRFLVERWTVKEARFKRDDLPTFTPRTIEDDDRVTIHHLTVHGIPFCCSIATAEDTSPRLITDIS